MNRFCTNHHEVVTTAKYCHECGVEVGRDLAAQLAEEMQAGRRVVANVVERGGKKVVTAKLSRNAMNRVKAMARSANNFINDVPISAKTFPDRGSHQAMVKLVDVILDTSEALVELAAGTDILDPEVIQEIQETAEHVEMSLGGEEGEHEKPLDEIDLDDFADAAGEVVIEEPDHEALESSAQY